jgi:hypothetical protein
MVFTRFINATLLSHKKFHKKIKLWMMHSSHEKCN